MVRGRIGVSDPRASAAETMSEPQEDSEDLVGRTIGGKYLVTRRIGRGGMGTVYEAENQDVGKRVALKFIDREWAKDETIASRFAREARAANAIESEHIVQVFDAGTDSGRPYIVMELLRGEDLGARLRRSGYIPPADALHVVAQVLRGLARAHEAGIVHRDLKPDNVFLSERAGDPLFATIVDFGISKIARAKSGTVPLALTQRGIVLGTPFYMAPEQAQAFSDVDPRADLYSVGAILFECLTARPPHTGETYEQVIVSICMRDAPDVRSVRPDVADDVAAFVKTALSRHRDARFPSAAAMLEALRRFAPKEPPIALLAKGTTLPLEVTDAYSPTAPAGAPTDVSWARAEVARLESRPRPRPRAAVIATACVALLAGLGITAGVVSAVSEAHEPRPPLPAAAPSASPHEDVSAQAAPSPPPPPVAEVASAPRAPAQAPVPTASSTPVRRVAPRTPPPAVVPRPRPAVTRTEAAKAQPAPNLDISRSLP